MDAELIVRNRILKIVNSKTRFPMKEGYLCEKDLRKELHLEENDIRVIITLLEKYFNILIQDEDIDNLRSVNDVICVVLKHRLKRDGTARRITLRNSYS